jgi:hypothetical protein
VTKSDRLDFRPLGIACSEHAWPYFETSCLRDPKRAGGQARPMIRVIMPERIAAK